MAELSLYFSHKFSVRLKDDLSDYKKLYRFKIIPYESVIKLDSNVHCFCLLLLLYNKKIYYTVRHTCELYCIQYVNTIRHQIIKHIGYKHLFMYSLAPVYLKYLLFINTCFKVYKVFSNRSVLQFVINKTHDRGLIPF